MGLLSGERQSGDIWCHLAAWAGGSDLLGAPGALEEGCSP